MSSITYQNLDTIGSYAKLVSAEKLDLTERLTPDRINRFETTIAGALRYNYAAKQVSESTIAHLQSIADEQQLIAKYQAIASGEVMNTGEGRMVLHHLCRGELAGPVVQQGRDFAEFYDEQRQRFSTFANQVHSGTICGTTGHQFENLVQIGIGGSDLGPRALFLALEGCEYHADRETRRSPRLKTRFLSNVDPDDAAGVLDGLNPKSTLLILVSKSGTTQETLTNEAFAVRWLAEGGIAHPRKHIVCVTSESSPLAASDEYLDSFFIDDYIGGRYSGTSAVGGVALSLAYSPEVFAEVLAGAHAADVASQASQVRDNAALMDGMIGVFERNVLGYPMTAILPYSQALLRFPAHLQQLDMESNGKQVSRDGEDLTYQSGPVVFGEPGTNGQHSFYQLLHQGTSVIPIQFIGFVSSQRGVDLEFNGSTSQAKLNANLAAQIVAFALGKADQVANRRFPGNRPSSVIYGDALTPFHLGALLAHFENKVMFQGLAWNINSFDQEGVQLGKILAKKVLLGDNVEPVLASYASKFGL